VVLQDTGIVWQNRGTSFSLDPKALNALKPGHLPFHTLNPSLALFDDGRVMPYGTMGGEGQPQTQAAVFTRYARFGQGLQQAVTAPRWLLGRTWGGETTSLKLESRFDPALVAALRAAGHEVEVFDEAFSDSMGHAGALVRHPNGVIEGAADPRSDGAVAAV
jgi:gamma-glutamyltranspeptidase